MKSIVAEGMEDGWDYPSIKEEDFDKYCTYIVPDKAVHDVTANRAQASLPRNLTFHPAARTIADVSTISIYLSHCRRFNIYFCNGIELNCLHRNKFQSEM